ncbi:hypothetical protein BDD12DRAFT_860123 [Trichophaea hybrida]|nr:hypothetical protein BDD12DRAFT_860123 [Trichophaea hybrida]
MSGPSPTSFPGSASSPIRTRIDLSMNALTSSSPSTAPPSSSSPRTIPPPPPYPYLQNSYPPPQLPSIHQDVVGLPPLSSATTHHHGTATPYHHQQQQQQQQQFQYPPQGMFSTAPPAPAPAVYSPKPRPSPTPAPAVAPANQIPPGGAPARRYLNDNVTPALLEGMKMLAREQPKEPLLALARFLEERHREERKGDVKMEDVMNGGGGD